MTTEREMQQNMIDSASSIADQFYGAVEDYFDRHRGRCPEDHLATVRMMAAHQMLIRSFANFITAKWEAGGRVTKPEEVVPAGEALNEQVGAAMQEILTANGIPMMIFRGKASRPELN